VREVAFSSDSLTLASASEDGTIKLWHRNGTLKRPPLVGHQGPVRSVHFSPLANPGWLVSGDVEGNIRLWKATGEPVRLLISDDTSAVLQVAFSPDGRTIVACRQSGVVELWEFPGRLITSLRGHSSRVNGVSFSADGTTLASVSNDQTAILWQPNAAPRLTVLNPPLSDHQPVPVYEVSFNPKKPQVVAIREDGNGVVWEIEDLQNPKAQLLQNSNGSYGSSIRFSLRGDRIVEGDGNGAIQLWTDAGDFVDLVPNAHAGGTYGVSFSPQGDRIASGGYDKLVKLWDISGNPLFTLTGHQNVVYSVEFNADGSQLLSASADNTAKLWNLQAKTLITTLEGHSEPVSSTAFSPTQDLIATASADQTIQLWNAQGQWLSTLSGHPDAVNSVRFSPDGQRLYGASNDGSIQIWEPNGQLIMTLVGHSGGVNSLSIKGNLLASSSQDGRVILWNQGADFLTLNSLVGQACKWANDYLKTHPSSNQQLCP
jgi:WD40 repeat protein